MTPVEFKAWFEGFTEALTGVPNKEQWKRIKARVSEIDGRPVTKEIFRERYWGPYYQGPWWMTTYTNTVPLNATSHATGSPPIGASYSTTSAIPVSFDSTQAMVALGRADAMQSKTA